MRLPCNASTCTCIRKYSPAEENAKLTQQGGCRFSSCGRWKMTCSWTDVCRGPGDEVRLSGTCVSLHTRLLRSVYPLLAGVTAPQRCLRCSQGLPSPGCWPVIASSIHVPLKALPPSPLNTFPFRLVQPQVPMPACPFPARGQPAAAGSWQQHLL